MFLEADTKKNQSAGSIIDRFDLRKPEGVRGLMDYVLDPDNKVWDPAKRNLVIMVESPTIAKEVESYLESIAGGKKFYEKLDGDGNSVGTLHVLDGRLSDHATK